MDGDHLTVLLCVCGRTVSEMCAVATLTGCVPIVASVERFPLFTTLIEVGAKASECG